jgi:hypothetical protein
MHAACEESQVVELSATSFEMGITRLPVARLCTLQDGGGTLQVAFTVVGIKP